MESNRFERLLAAVAPVQWRARPDGYATDLRSWSAYTGRSEEEDEGWGWLETIHPDDRDGTLAAWKEATASAGIYHVQYRVRGRDGTYRWFDVHGVPLRDDAGTIVEWYGVCLDIQDGMAAESQLRSILDNMSEAFVSIQRDWTISFQNREGARINNKTPEEVVGRHMFEEWPEVPGSALEANYRRAWETGEPVRFEHRYYDPGKYDVWLDIQAVPADDGGLGIFYRNITDEKLTQQKVLESEGRFRQLADHLKAAFLLTSDDGREIYYASPYLAELTGRPAEAVIADPDCLTKAVHPQDREWVSELVWSDPRGDASSEYRLVTEGEDERWVSHRRTSVPSRGDGSARVAHILTDITEQRKVEAQLRHAQRMDSLGQLAGGVAHDFNNILTVIMGRASLLHMRLRDQMGLADIPELDEIEEAAARGADITRQILTFSRDQIGHPRNIDVNAAIKNASSLMNGLVGEGVEITALLDDGLPPVYIDPTQFDQVLMNLSANAADAMEGEGTLTVSTSLVEVGTSGRWDVSVDPGTYVCLRVKDTGPGVPDSARERIFDPFFSTKSDKGGTGLGLATCFGIITRAGGGIDLVDPAEGGAEFQVLVPAVTGHIAATSADGAQLAVRGEERLLVVEDEWSLRHLVGDVLSAAGYEVYLAANGDQALAQLDAHPDVDLLVTDMVMPGMSGNQLAREALRRHPNLLVLTVSGYRAGERAVRSAVPEELAFLAKPFTPAELAARIREILDSVER